MHFQAKLRAITPSENKYRQYEIETRPGDDGGFVLVTRRGRIGKPLRGREDHFNSLEALVEEVARLIRLRTVHGYVLAR